MILPITNVTMSAKISCFLFLIGLQDIIMSDIDKDKVGIFNTDNLMDISIWKFEREDDNEPAFNGVERNVDIFRSNEIYVISIIDDMLYNANVQDQPVYYWIGKDTNREDAGDAASFAAFVDSALPRLPSVKLQREAEGKESSEFKELCRRLENVRRKMDKFYKGFQRVIDVSESGLKLDQVDIKTSQKELVLDLNLIRIHGERNPIVDYNFMYGPPVTSLKQLRITDCYIIDTQSNKGLFVWMGKKASIEARMESAKHAEQYFTVKNYDYDTPITFIGQVDLRLPPEASSVQDMIRYLIYQQNSKTVL